MKKALVHDWYYTNGGAEKVVKSINELWDDWDHFSSIDFLTDQDRNEIIGGKKVQTTFIQHLPTAKNNHRKFLQLFPYAMEQLDLSSYELIVSSSSSVAKGVLTTPQQLHICYCHTPIRYVWDLYQDYLISNNLKSGLKSIYAKYVLSKIRIWDVVNSNRVDHFIANSHFVARRIQKIYRRNADVIYPPVNTEFFTLETQKDDYYFTSSRLVSNKNVQQIIEAFNQLPVKKLYIAGDGPDMQKLKKIAKENIVFLGYISNKQLKKYLSHAKAYVFASVEDFGIAPVEAQSCGTPVICLNKGGCRETVINNITGIHFEHPTAKHIIESIQRFETMQFDGERIRENALRFSNEIFETNMKNFIEAKFFEHQKMIHY